MFKKHQCNVCNKKYWEQQKAIDCCPETKRESMFFTWGGQTISLINKVEASDVNEFDDDTEDEDIEDNGREIHKTEWRTYEESHDVIELDLTKMNKDQLLDLYGDYHKLSQTFDENEYKDVLEAIKSEFNNRILNKDYKEPDRRVISLFGGWGW